jgi:hypothetical protein
MMLRSAVLVVGVGKCEGIQDFYVNARTACGARPTRLQPSCCIMLIVFESPSEREVLFHIAFHKLMNGGRIMAYLCNLPVQSLNLRAMKYKAVIKTDLTAW